MTEKQKHITNIITAVLFLLIVWSLSVAFILKKADDFSETERRKLETFPEHDIDYIISGDFGTDFNEYLCDQFPLRDTFVGIKAFVEKILQKGENNGVLFGKNNQLAVRLFAATDGLLHGEDYVSPNVDFFYEDVVKAELNALEKLSDSLKEKNVTISVILPPRTIDVAVSAFSYPTENSDKLITLVRDGLENVNFCDIYDEFRERYENGEYIYYKTDHHWTSLGAYYAYVSVMESFGMEAYPIESFDIETVSDDFKGTTYSKSGIKSDISDEITKITLKTDDEFVSEIHDGTSDRISKTLNGFYDEEYLDSYDKYCYFLSGTNAVTEIKKVSDGERKTLLVFKDSFGHSLVPFLAYHFDIIMVNYVDYIDKNMVDMLKEFDADKVLICFNLENVITSDKLARAGKIAQIFN